MEQSTVAQYCTPSTALYTLQILLQTHIHSRQHYTAAQGPCMQRIAALYFLEFPKAGPVANCTGLANFSSITSDSPGEPTAAPTNSRPGTDAISCRLRKSSRKCHAFLQCCRGTERVVCYRRPRCLLFIRCLLRQRSPALQAAMPVSTRVHGHIDKVAFPVLPSQCLSPCLGTYRSTLLLLLPTQNSLVQTRRSLNHRASRLLHGCHSDSGTELA